MKESLLDKIKNYKHYIMPIVLIVAWGIIVCLDVLLELSDPVPIVTLYICFSMCLIAYMSELSGR